MAGGFSRRNRRGNGAGGSGGGKDGGGGGFFQSVFGSNDERQEAVRGAQSAGPAITSTLRKGSKGAEVEALQRFLGVAVDGDFGGGTKAALQAWQRANGLEPDGIAGKNTRAALGGGGAGAAPKAELPAWAKEEEGGEGGESGKSGESKAASKPSGKAAAASKGGKKNPPKGTLKNRHHDEEKFVPGYAATAYSESAQYRKESDPYAVGAITNPRKDQDYGGKTYGAYQFESFVYRDGKAASSRLKANSTVMRFIRWSGNPYGKQLQEVVTKHGIASAQFDAAWGQLTSANNKAFGEAQEAFMEVEVKEKVNAWFDSAGVSSSARKDPRLFDLITGTLNQYGTLSDGYARKVAEAQRKARRALTADEVGQALQDAKWGGVQSNFRSSPKAWGGIYNRVNREGAMFDGYEQKKKPV